MMRVETEEKKAREEYDIRQYIDQLLGVSLEREVSELLSEVIKNSGDDEIEKTGRAILKLCKADLKLSMTSPHQLETLARFLGWILDHWRAMIEAHRFKSVIDKLPLSQDSKEACKTILNEIKRSYGRITSRFIIAFLYWINALPSTHGEAFKRLTSRTEIVHSFIGRVEEKEEDKLLR